MSIKSDIAAMVARFREVATKQIETAGLRNGSIEIHVSNGKYVKYKVTNHGT
jgi:hypothetical protein